MAATLVERGFVVRVWNRTEEQARAFERASRTLVTSGRGRAHALATPRECVEGVAIVVTMLSDRAALEAVLGGADGILAGLAKGAVVVEMSTIGRAAALAAAAEVKRAGGRFIDAPVSGSVTPAGRGELIGLVGGSVTDMRRAEPVLTVLCKRILHAGAVGQGQALKVLLNGVGAHHLIAFASMLALGEKAGLSRTTVVDAFTMGAFASPSYIGKRAKVLARDFSAEFSLALTLKDTLLNAELQDEVGLRLPVHREIIREITEAVAEGLGEEDLFAIEKHFSRAP